MTDRNLSAEKVIDVMSERFTSGNSIPVERAHVNRDEWRVVLERFKQIATESHVAARGSSCARCRLAGAIVAALEGLS